MYFDSICLSAKSRLFGTLFSAAIRVGFVCAAMLTIAASPAGGQVAPPPPAPVGLAWQVQGQWLGNNGQTAIVNETPIAAGALLQPVGNAPDHSIAILLPDGQRVFYECFLAQDCARGFLVPNLMTVPDPFAVDMLARIRTVLAHQRPRTPGPGAGLQIPVPRDELVLPLDPTNQVQIGGLAESLPNGAYVCYVRRIGAWNTQVLRIQVTKSALLLPLTLPGAGLYDIRIRDSFNTLRIDLFAAAEPAVLVQALAMPFNQARALMNAWNQVFYGWPEDDLLRAYLKVLAFNVQPTANEVVVTANAPQGAGVAAQPQFSPPAGYFAGETPVSLQSATQGATIHYTLDGSQPTLSSPVFSAPVIVEATGLTIKSFAGAPGMKDSPVVTGTFLIQQPTQ
jgi:hypothetical protein